MPKQSLFTSTNSKMGSIPKYEKGGVVEGSNPNIDDATRARARNATFEVAAKAIPTRNKVVTKEELTKSGLSLRDYMNKQQGLTRRGGANPTLGGRNQAEQDAADKVDYAQVLQSREQVRGSRGSRPEPAKTPMSKEDYMQSREQYKRAQDEAPMQTFEKGGLVKKPKESNMYHAGMDQPKNPDMMTSLTPEQRKAAEARMKAEERKKK